jgi:two-component system alkaline phosphatase synthesis response regulator PhoP
MSKRILVIDDEEPVREVFVLALSRIGYTVETAADGESGLAKAEAQPPDLIFLDLRMPGMDGVAVLRRLQRPGGCCKGVPVCIVTAFRKEFMEPLNKAIATEKLYFEIADKPLTVEQIQAIARGKLEGEAVG